MTEFAFLKDPNATLDYRVDWSAWLDGDAIVSAAWLVPDGLTLMASSVTESEATAWLSGGAEGKDYRVVSRITTEAGRVNDQSITIKIRGR